MINGNVVGPGVAGNDREVYVYEVCFRCHGNSYTNIFAGDRFPDDTTHRSDPRDQLPGNPSFSYRGFFSGFIKMDIAHASFRVTSQPLSINGRPLYRASVDVSTEAYPQAELIYPFRYHNRSWLEAVRQTPVLALESILTDETEEELLWFDRERGLGFRYHKNRHAAGGRAAGLPVIRVRARSRGMVAGGGCPSATAARK